MIGALCGFGPFAVLRVVPIPLHSPRAQSRAVCGVARCRFGDGARPTLANARPSPIRVFWRERMTMVAMRAGRTRPRWCIPAHRIRSLRYLFEVCRVSAFGISAHMVNDQGRVKRADERAIDQTVQQPVFGPQAYLSVSVAKTAGPFPTPITSLHTRPPCGERRTSLEKFNDSWRRFHTCKLQHMVV